MYCIYRYIIEIYIEDKLLIIYIINMYVLIICLHIDNIYYE